MHHAGPAASRRAVRRVVAAGGVAAIATLGLGGVPAGAYEDDDGNVVIDIVGINDFHGRISEVDNPTDPGNVDVPRRAARLASALQDIRLGTPDFGEAGPPEGFVERDGNQDTIFVSAGDSIGGTTFVSMINDDVPTLDVLNEVGLVASALGNHEFDQGREALQARIDDGQVEFPYLGTNVEVPDDADEFADYHVHTVANPVGDEVRVGFIGVLTEDMESLVAADGIAGMEFTDMTEAALEAAEELRDGDLADVVVVLAHEGAPTPGAVTDPSTRFGGFVDALADSGHIDAVFSGHTHVRYEATVRGMPVVQTAGLATGMTRIQLSVSPEGDVTAEEVEWIGLADYPLRDGDPMVGNVTDIVRAAEERAEELGSVEIGEIDRDLNRARQSDGETENRGGESTVGNLIADAQLWAAREQYPDNPPAVAFMNPGGIRADIRSEGGTVTYADVATAQPFGNTLVTMDLTGADIIQVLEEQWQPDGADRPFLKLGVSESLFYFYDPQAPPGERIIQVFIEGEELDEATTYPVVTNSFLGSGVGDNFFAFGEGTNRADAGLIDLAAFVDYFAAHDLVQAPLDQRAVGVHWVSDRQAAYSPGDEIAVDLSSLSFSTDEPKPDELVLSLYHEDADEPVELGTVPVDNSVVDTTDEVGRAEIRVTVPEIEGLGSPVEWQLEAADEVSGYSYWVGVYLAAAEETPTPTPEPTTEPTSPEPTSPPASPTPTAPGGDLPSTGAETNGPLIAGGAFVLLGTLLVAGAALQRRRTAVTE